MKPETGNQHILNQIHEATSPQTMTKEESINFINDMIQDLKMMLESLEIDDTKEDEL